MLHMSRRNKLLAVLIASLAFFILEIAIGFKTGSLALIADAFHYFNDIVSFAVALVATMLGSRTTAPPEFTYAYKRAETVGAFFNASFLLALALFIVLQSIERFIDLPEIEEPKLVVIVGAVGLGLNIICILLVHGTAEDVEMAPSPSSLSPTSTANRPLLDHSGHNHAKTARDVNAERNLGLLGVIAHLMGDVVNNLGVIVSGLLMWKLESPQRFYADPAITLFIGLVIFFGAIPLTKRSCRVLLQTCPPNIQIEHVTEDLLSVPGVLSIRDFHLWHLNESDIVASMRIECKPSNIGDWLAIEADLVDCLSAYGINHVTISPEVSSAPQTPLPEYAGSCTLNRLK